MTRIDELRAEYDALSPREDENYSAREGKREALFEHLADIATAATKRVEELGDRCITIADEACGLQPVMPPDDALTLIERKLYEQRVRVEELEEENGKLDGRRREGRQLLRRLVKYVKEDRAETPGTTRLARLTEQIADYLNRTGEPGDILRSEGPASSKEGTDG